MTPLLPATRSRPRGYRQSRLDPVSSAPAVGTVGLLWQYRTSPPGLRATGPPLTRPRGSREKPDG